MFGMFKKKDPVSIKNIEEKTIDTNSVNNLDKIEKNEEKILHIKENKEKIKENFITLQSIDMGMDMKHEVEVFSKAFFQSKNSDKIKAYTSLHRFMLTMEKYEIEMIKNMTYLEFKEKEEQVRNKIKLGFSQYLSKGSHINEETRKIIDLVFADIKKLPSRGHRYWYYKIYIWQEAKERD